MKADSSKNTQKVQSNQPQLNTTTDSDNDRNEIFNSNLEYKVIYDKPQNFEVDESYISKNMNKSEQFDTTCLKIEDFTCYTDKVNENKRFDKFIDHYLTKDDDKKFLAKVNETFQKETFDSFRGNIKGGRLSTLENLVEVTYNSDRKLKDTMVEQLCNLEKIIYRWRTIGGDGNCYYRSVMFAYMENIVFEKNTTLLKKVMTDIYEKFESDYPNLQKLPFAIRRDILNLKKKVILHLLYLIYFFLDKSLTQTSDKEKERYQNLAYELLLKSFNLASDFDLGLVFYFRFMLYEYILENGDKMLHKEFPVCLGNLLPQEYETDDGKFLWAKFFEEHLLKLGIYAEKIVIYLTPYVLKTNVKLLIFDYGKDYLIETKKFICHLPNKTEIVTLYRKCHYDLSYSKTYFDKYSKFLCTYVNLNEEIKILTFDIINNHRKNNVSNNFLDYENMQSVCFTNKNIEKVKKPEEKKEEVKEVKAVLDDKSNIGNSTKVEDNSVLSNRDNSNNLSKEDVIDINSYEMPDSPEKTDPLAGLINKYKDFLVKSKELYNTKRFVEIMKIKNDMIHSKTESNKQSLITEIKKIKNQVCCICLTNIFFSKEKIKFPCDCYVCGDKCFKELEKLLIGNYNSSVNLMCICSTVYNGEDMRKLYQLLKENNYLEGVKKILSSFTYRFINTCLQCNQTLSIRDSTLFTKLTLKDKNICDIFNFKRFTHKICSTCYSTNVKRASIQCFICSAEHEVVSSVI